MTDLPTVNPFWYVYIPAVETQAVEERQFTGNSEEELRATLTRHFRSVLMSEDAKKAMGLHLAAEAEKNMKKHSRVEEVNSSPTPAAQDALIAGYLEQNAYEVVPIVMPSLRNAFVGVSLYVDDCGQFKDLPLNSRACQLAQREVRGDAFMLSNHDDPALDAWERVDTHLPQYEAIYASPSNAPINVHDSTQMASANQQREDAAKRIEEADILKAMEAKADGNRHVSAAEWAEAVASYSTAVDLTTGRRDLLADEQGATQLRVSVLLNRCLCFLKLQKFSKAVPDAEDVLRLDAANLKAMYRLAQAQTGLREIGAANITIDLFERSQGSADDVKCLRAAAQEASQALRSQEKKMYGKMFS